MNENSYNELKSRKFIITETNINNTLYHEVNDGNEKGFGNTLYKTREEAQEGINLTCRQLNEYEDWQGKEQERKEQERKEQEQDVLTFKHTMYAGEGDIRSDVLESVLEHYTGKYQLPLKWQRTRQNLSKAVLRDNKVVTIWKFNRTTVKAVNDMIHHVYININEL